MTFNNVFINVIHIICWTTASIVVGEINDYHKFINILPDSVYEIRIVVHGRIGYYDSIDNNESLPARIQEEGNNVQVQFANNTFLNLHFIDTIRKGCVDVYPLKGEKLLLVDFEDDVRLILYNRKKDVKPPQFEFRFLLDDYSKAVVKIDNHYYVVVFTKELATVLDRLAQLSHDRVRITSICNTDSLYKKLITNTDSCSIKK